ncbi:MAG: AMP-binding protein, partial [Phycisphaerales bacterium]|nr:AMP-binding protein [Phycisphaerales bacterium]
YSSGTTGRKKGVMISHRALRSQINAYARAIDLRDGDLIVSWLPLYHDMGLIACLLLPLMTRTPLVAMCPFAWARRPAMWPRGVSRFGGTLSWLPNFAYSFMARSIAEADLDGVSLKSLRGVVNCSEPVLAASHDAFCARFAPYGFNKAALATSYAMAENTFAVTSAGFGTPVREIVVDNAVFQREGRAEAASADVTKRLVSSGVALPDTDIRVIDDNGASLPERHVGEITLRSPCMLTGYFRNEDATRRALPDGRLHTGDLGFLADGHLYVIGRKHDVMCVRGQTLHPQDIEQIVSETNGVTPGRCVAFGVIDDDAGTERVVIIAETREPLDRIADSLAGAIRRRVAEATDLTPDDVRIVEPMWLRKSSSGKLSRAANRERYLALLVKPTDARDALARIRACVEQTLRELRAPVSSVADDEALITSGLIDSLGLAALLNHLETTFGRRISDDRLRDPRSIDTIRALTKAIAASATVECGTSNQAAGYAQGAKSQDAEPLLLTFDTNHPVTPSRRRMNFWSLYYRTALQLRGVRVGRRLRVLGPLLLRFDGDPRNVVIGDDVTLMPWVDLKVRENGRITLHNRVTLDTGVRLVAANDAHIVIGEEAQLGYGTLVNAGADVAIGRRAAIAGRCSIIASEHRYESREPLFSQGYRHAPVTIGQDAWLASDAFVGPGVTIGAGAVIAVKSVVSAAIPDYAVAAGVPARVIRYRGQID